MAKTVADALLERLMSWGVDTIFGYPGDGVNGIFEALRTHSERIRFIQVRHEESAAFAACGYAKFTGRLGVCLATSGPGGIHLLNGLYDAKSDGVPVLAITGHTYHDLIGTHYQQDVDLDKAFADVAVYNQRVMGPAHLENVLDEAVRMALGQHGVAHITIPKDFQELKATAGQRSPVNVPKHSAALFAAAHPVPPLASLEAAAELINRGKKVAILVGRGALGAREEVLQLADTVAGPVIKALLGKAVVPDANPYTTGGIGLLGTAPSGEAMQECDTLIIAGSSFPYLDFYPKPGKAKVVQIDVWPSRIGLRQPVDVPLAGDCRSTLRALMPLLERKQDRSFLEKAQSRMRDWNRVLEQRASRDDMPMKPQVVVHQLSRLLAPNAIVTTDSGTVTTWAARHIEMRDEMQFSLSGTLATMANALPYAIGAAAAFPDRQIVAIIGDGGFTMLMGEMATLVKYNMNVKVVVLKNNVLGMIKWEQIVMEGNPQFGVELQPIDFAGVAMCCGAAGFTAERPDEVANVLRRALEHDGPAVVQAVVDAHEPPLPGQVSTEQTVKFAEAILRGQKEGWSILKNVIAEKVREVV